jgi:acid phosphatase type 7
VLFALGGTSAVHLEVKRPGDPVVVEHEAGVDTSAHPAGAVQMRADLSGLATGEIHCYRVVAGDQALTEWTGFRTADPPGGTARFAIWGDSGTGSSAQRAVLGQILTVPFDFIVHTGDVAYDHGTLDQFEQHVFGVYSGVFRNFPIYPTAGNHDYATGDDAAYREVFALPENGGEDGRERWYSFDWADVHLVALDTERMLREQDAWLEADLTATTRPWTVVFLHRALFSSGEHGPSQPARDHFQAIFERHRVPLVLCGHEHDYERFHTINGVTYVVTGGGGAEAREVFPSPSTAYGEGVLHFLYANVNAGQLALHAIDGVGREFDSLVLRRALE